MADRPWPGQTMAEPSRLRRLKIGAIGLTLLSLTVLATVLWPPRPFLVWNSTPSSPTGLYLVGSAHGLKAADHVIAWAPGWARRLGAERHYIPYNLPLVKRVAAAPGDDVCAIKGVILIDGKRLARRRPSDAAGRPMPAWEGCRKLGTDDYFLFDPSQPEAFDGRYFGMTPAKLLVGKARLIWRS